MLGRDFLARFGGGFRAKLNGADFDRDGDIDWVVSFGLGEGARDTFSGAWVFQNIGSRLRGFLDRGRSLGSPEQTSGQVPYVGDANADGRPDIYCGGLLWLNESAGGLLSFGEPHPAEDPGWAWPGSVDWDSDGVLDRLEEDALGLVLRDGRSGKPKRLAVGGETVLGDTNYFPFACDWNGDGEVDVLLGAECGHVAFVERRHGTLLSPEFVFQAWPDIKAGDSSVPCVGDWDLDGDLDLICGNGAGFVEWFSNEEGILRYRERLRAGWRQIRVHAGERTPIDGTGDPRRGHACPAVGDWDLDGDLDLIVGCGTGEILLHENFGGDGAPRLAVARRLRIDEAGASAGGLPGVEGDFRPGDLRTPPRTRPLILDANGDALPDLVTLDLEGFLVLYPRFRGSDGSLGLGAPLRFFRDTDARPLRFAVPEVAERKVAGPEMAGPEVANRGVAEREVAGPGVAGPEVANPEAGAREGGVAFDFCDWDGDGDRDIIRSGGTKDGTSRERNGANFAWFECVRVGGTTGAEVAYVWRGELLPSETLRLQGTHSSPVAIDLDGDGELDLISGAEDGCVYWFARGILEVGP